MYLTNEEERTLGGEYGETLRKATEILVALGDIYGADQLIPVKSAQIAGVSYKTIGDAGLEWISDLTGTVRVPAILNPAGMDLKRWQDMGISETFARKQLEVIQAYEDLGVRPMCTCTPYYLEGFSAKYGDHLAWSESSAVSYANSVIGARTNREGGPSALAAALVGKTANYGYHLDENRQPTVSVSVECELSDSDYGALGYLVGKDVGNRVPLFNMNARPVPDNLKSLGAAMAASGAVALYHVKGITPDIRQMDVEQPDETIVVEREQIDEVYTSILGEDGGADTDIAALGCPHASVAELETIADRLANRTVTRQLWVCTSREVAEGHPDLVRRIEKSGAMVLCDTCMVVSPATERYQSMIVNSGKAFAYLPGMCHVAARMGDVDECIRKVCDPDEN
ncbi:MAG: aconitase X catalytic domain-containing protein [Euryarchaeota archaeon]|nr:aconitase X catalytic domain-containing protein [Euryarchaeota archaeon]